MNAALCVLGFAALLWSSEHAGSGQRGAWRWMALSGAAFVWGLTGLLIEPGALTEWARAVGSLSAATFTARLGREMSAVPAAEPTHLP